ncbi:Scr1 family TA system antitoxin-like transcriptional regulator [Amycolatopsis lexingtonensis]|uniref:Scr1 family TA system antitoxin-like transcriptional regulator n=1 Tax=Amycolatopsis lexingtonensis TaxID=218822 RepID=UPI003F713503
MATAKIRTPASIAAGLGLNALREQRKIGVRELARRLGVSPSLISGYEHGTHGVKPTRISRILGCLLVQGAEYDQMMDLADHLAVKNFVDQTTSPVTDLFATYEQLSTRIVEWSPFRIPDPLRVPRWLETAPDGEIKPSDRLDQESFHQRCRPLPAKQPNRSYVFLIGDQALQMACEDTGTAAQQIALIREADRREDVTVRVASSRPSERNPATAFTVFEDRRTVLATALRHEHCTAYLTDKALLNDYHRTARALLRKNLGESATVDAWLGAAYDRTS